MSIIVTAISGMVLILAGLVFSQGVVGVSQEQWHSYEWCFHPPADRSEIQHAHDYEKRRAAISFVATFTIILGATVFAGFIAGLAGLITSVALLLTALIPLCFAIISALKARDLNNADSEEYEGLDSISENALVRAYLHAVRAKNRRFLTKAEVERLKNLAEEDARRATSMRLTKLP